MKIKYLLLSLLALACSLMAAQLPPELAEIPLPSDPEIHLGTLENGITYYVLQNSRPANIAELRLYVDAGSILEDDDQLGLAHFTEHMAFNGTTSFERSEIVEYLSSIGMGYANGLNAMTSFDFTIYQFKIPTDEQEQLEMGFKILSEMANELSFSPEELEKERGVIIEEWRMGQNTQSRISDQIYKVRFAGSRYATRMPIGTYEMLTSFERDQIVRFYEDWYRPDLQSVVVIGDLDPEMAISLVEEYFGDIPAHENPRAREIYEVPDYPEPRAVVAIDPEYPYSSISAAWSRDSSEFGTVGDYYRSLHETLFFTMLNARLEELLQAEDPPFSFAYARSGAMMKGFGATEMMAYAAEGRNREALRTLLIEAERVRRHGFTEGELARAKTTLIRQLEKAVEESDTRDSNAIVWSILSSLITGDTILSAEQNLNLANQFIHSIPLQNVNAVIDDLITEENLTISYTSTDKEGAKHPTEDQLIAVYGEVQDMEIEAYEDTEVLEPLMAEIPAKGQIINRTSYPQSGIQELTLSNGIKVYYKKTDFKADEILFSAKSIGGYSRYDTNGAMAAQLLNSYLDNSGVGDFDRNAMSRLLTGKIANVSLNIDEYHEGFSGSASPRDLETMFQLIYQYGTNPRFEQSSLTSLINQIKPFIENQNLNPQVVFFDSLTTISYDHHPLKKRMNVDHLNELELSKMMDVYRDRFADFSDFSFFFVGNFEEELLEEYAKIYLANLPVSQREDKIVDKGIMPIKGKHELRFQKGSNESAYVAHKTTGSIKLNHENMIVLNAAINVLNEKLRENIREELSGVYVVTSWPETGQHPQEHCNVTIFMTCSPDRVDELNAAIMATVDSVCAGEFEERFVEASKAVLSKQYEENISKNSYWQNQMISAVLGAEEMDSFLEHPARIARLDKKSITKAAKRYFQFDKNLLTVIMTPETSALNNQQEE